MSQDFEIPPFIARETYLKKLEPFAGKSIIKVITGQRRVGKSYLLFQVMDRLKQLNPEINIIYINKEDMGFADLRNADDLHNYVKSKVISYRQNALFVDEVQEIENFYVALRSILLWPDTDIYITGSNANLLSSDLAGYLSGRFIEVNVYSLSYLEFLQFHQLADHDNSLHMYLKYGGLPYIKHLPLQDNVVFEYLKNIYSTIIYRDVVNRFAIRNTMFLEKLVLFLAQHTGSLFSAKKISDFLKSQQININPAQVIQYLGYLASAFLVIPVPRYDIQGKRIFEFGEKFFFENIGIRNAIAGFRPQDMHMIIENAVCHHLMLGGYQLKVGEIGGNEIDFVAEKDGETAYFQVALRLQEEKTMEREFGNLDEIPDHFPKKVISLDHFQGNTYKGIEYQSLKEFLSSW